MLPKSDSFYFANNEEAYHKEHACISGRWHSEHYAIECDTNDSSSPHLEEVGLIDRGCGLTQLQIIGA